MLLLAWQRLTFMHKINGSVMDSLTKWNSLFSQGSCMNKLVTKYLDDNFQLSHSKFLHCNIQLKTNLYTFQVLFPNMSSSVWSITMTQSCRHSIRWRELYCGISRVWPGRQSFTIAKIQVQNTHMLRSRKTCNMWLPNRWRICQLCSRPSKINCFLSLKISYTKMFYDLSKEINIPNSPRSTRSYLCW